MKQTPFFQKWEECCFLFSSDFNTLLVNFHASSRAPCSLPLCLLLRPILKFWSVGATVTKFTWANKSERWILVSNFSVTRNNLCEFHTLDWFPHVCTSGEWTSAASCLEIRNPIAMQLIIDVEMTFVPTV